MRKAPRALSFLGGGGYTEKRGDGEINRNGKWVEKLLTPGEGVMSKSGGGCASFVLTVRGGDQGIRLHQSRGKGRHYRDLEGWGEYDTI